MPRLNAESKEAIDRLRSYKPPPTNYGSVPLSRRAAVLVLLYADARGNLRVVLTVRAKTLSSFAGQVALPGGRADSLEETAFDTARREAQEEIGLPDDTTASLERRRLPGSFRVEHLCELPASFAKSKLVVRPCVALLHSYDEKTGEDADPEVSLIPKLDPREVAAVFTVSFRDLLSSRDANDPDGDPEEWYQGAWGEWHGYPWRMHEFFVPTTMTKVAKSQPKTAPEKFTLDQSRHRESPDQPGKPAKRYRLWGMTARILVDAARIAYARDPDFEHNSQPGDEEMITALRKMGRLGPVRRPSRESGLTRGSAPGSKLA